MNAEIHNALDEIVTQVCDNYCVHAAICTNQDDLDKHCSNCRWLDDLYNLVETPAQKIPS